MTVTVIGYFILSNIDFYDFISPVFSLVLSLVGKVVSNTKDGV